MNTTTLKKWARIARSGLVSIFLFVGVALFSSLPLAAERGADEAAGGAETKDIGKIVEDERGECVETDLTEKDMPKVMEFYSQYTDETKAAVVQTGQCLAMMAEDDAACDLFKGMGNDSVYRVGVAPPGATPTAALNPATGPSDALYTTYSAGRKGCLDLRKLAAVMRKAVASPAECARELPGYCNRELKKLIDPKNKSLTCDIFTKFTCMMFDVDDHDGCDTVFEEQDKSKTVTKPSAPRKFCHAILNGEGRGIAGWMRILWLGGALKDRKWPVLQSDFVKDYVQVDPACEVYAGAVKKLNDCFMPISFAVKADICDAFAKNKAGFPAPGKEPRPAGGDGAK